MTRDLAGLSDRERRWAYCYACDQPVNDVFAVWFGRSPSFSTPAICICARCLRAAIAEIERPRRRRVVVTRLDRGGRKQVPRSRGSKPAKGHKRR